ncbi:MAG: glycoside hydrolase family 32 protein [Actinomycetes bacterium]
MTHTVTHSTPESLPALHVRPTRGWLNDPNGITRHAGRWHVFFQHNPSRARHAAIHWGHVSSPDLVSWTEHPVAFGPEPGSPDAGGSWSGCFVPGLDRPAVVYTGIVDSPGESTVCLRWAEDDDLVTWSRPVVVATQPVEPWLAAMRDPYPFTWDGRRFALLGAGTTDGTPLVLLFSCDDPLAWRYEGVWLDGRDPVATSVAPAHIWECPQLVALGGRHALVVSLWEDHVLGDVVHLLGRLVGDAGGLPRFVPESGGLLDEGPDFYAPQVVPDADGPLLFGWVRQQDAPDEATQDAVAGCLTLPRRLRLDGDQVVVQPDAGVAALVGPPVDLAPDDDIRLPPRVRVTLRALDGAVGGELRGDACIVPLTVDDDGCEVWLDGEVAEVYRPGRVAATARCPGTAAWRLAVDRGRVEVSATRLRLP